MNISEIRKKYPQYKDLTDTQIAQGFHQKFYSDIPYEEFASSIGVGKMITAPGPRGPSGRMYVSPERLAEAEERNTIPKSLAKLPGDVGRAADDIVRRMAGTMSFGYADKLAAAANAGIGIGDYQQNLAKERERTAQATERLGPAAALADVAGMVATARPLMAVSPAVRMAPRLSQSFVGRNVAVPALMAGEGAVIGGLAASGNDQDVGEGALFGAATGLGLGAGLNLVSGAFSIGMNTYAKMRNWNASRSVPPAQKKAFDKLLSELEAEGVTPEQAAAMAKSAAGERGMVADITPGLQQTTGGVAVSDPGAATIISRNLEERFRAAPGEMKTALDVNIGPYRDPQLVRAESEALRGKAAPLFQQIEGYAIPLDDVSKAISEALKTYGPNTGIGQTLLRARRAITDRSGNLISNGRAVVGARDEIQRLVDLAYKESGTAGEALRPIRDAINAAIVKNVPDRKIANQMYRQSKLMDEAFDYGRTLLTGGPNTVTPGQLADKFRKLRAENPEAAKMVVQGFRTELDRLSQVSRGKGNVVDRALSRDYNAEKLRELIGDKADEIIKLIDQQATQLETLNVAVPGRGSATAGRTAARERLFPERKAQGILEEVAAAAAGGTLGGPIGAGVAAAGVLLRRFGRNVAENFAELTKPEQAQFMARFLTATGDEQTRLVKQLSDYAKAIKSPQSARAKSNALREAISRSAPLTSQAFARTPGLLGEEQ